jgi:hypothetical protein
LAVADELGQHALGEHCVGQIETRKFILMRLGRHRQLFDEPVVQRPVVLELQRADRMRDAFDGIRLAVRIVVAWIDRPFGAGARMMRMQDAVQHGVAQVDVAGDHADLGAQHARTVRKLAGLHAAEQVEILLD